MQDSVELPTPLAVVNICLRSEPASTEDQIVPWRRRSRMRRILNQLRVIRRTQPHIRFSYTRCDWVVYCILETERDRTLFSLCWPQNLPAWIELDID